MIGECHEWSSNPMSTDRGGIGLILIAFAVHGIFAMNNCRNRRLRHLPEHVASIYVYRRTRSQSLLRQRGPRYHQGTSRRLPAQGNVVNPLSSCSPTRDIVFPSLLHARFDLVAMLWQIVEMLTLFGCRRCNV